MTKPKPQPVPPPEPVCKVDGCTADETYTRGLCALHWCTRSDLADPLPPPEPTDTPLKQGPTLGV